MIEVKQETVAMQMDVIVVNLVREGINKHRARELAEHFIKHAQPKAEQEPVAWMDKTGITHKHRHFEDMQPLYNHPQPKREWVGLTDKEYSICLSAAIDRDYRGVADAVEKKLKEKNT